MVKRTKTNRFSCSLAYHARWFQQIHATYIFKMIDIAWGGPMLILTTWLLKFLEFNSSPPHTERRYGPELQRTWPIYDITVIYVCINCLRVCRCCYYKKKRYLFRDQGGQRLNNRFHLKNAKLERVEPKFQEEFFVVIFFVLSPFLQFPNLKYALLGSKFKFNWIYQVCFQFNFPWLMIFQTNFLNRIN